MRETILGKWRLPYGCGSGIPTTQSRRKSEKKKSSCGPAIGGAPGKKRGLQSTRSGCDNRFHGSEARLIALGEKGMRRSFTAVRLHVLQRGASGATIRCKGTGGSLMKDIELLETAATEIEWTPDGMPDGTPHGIIKPEGSLSFTRKGFVAVSGLARSLQQNQAALRRGSKFESLRKVVANTVLREFESRLQQGPAVRREDLAALKDVVTDWFAKASVTRTYVVPCAVIPYPGQAFDVGPVRFIDASDFDLANLGVEVDIVGETAWETIERQLREHAARWVAVVEVTGCEGARGAEIADTVVDIALAGVQAVLGTDARFMARLTARANPPYQGRLAVSENEISMGVQNMEAGRLLLPETLQSVLGAAEELIRSFGNRINTFLSGASDLQALEQAWCDGAYWFHEGLAEPMDTVAVAKLETAMENLLAAGSTSGSRERIRTALRTMVGDDSDQAVERAQVEFAKRVVQARSTVLHGTRSTTRDDPGIDRGSVEMVVQRILSAYSLLLDAYSGEDAEHVTDDVGSFLDWIDRARTNT